MIRSILLIMGLVISLPSFAVMCLQSLELKSGLSTAVPYVCDPQSSTTCVRIPALPLFRDSFSPVASCNYLVISGVEYSQFVADSIAQALLVARVTNLEAKVFNLETRSIGLEPRVTAIESAYNAVINQINALSNTVTQSAGSVAGLTAQLNTPFDLNTALLAMAFFYSTVLFFYGISKGAGAILTMIRRPTGR